MTIRFLSSRDGYAIGSVVSTLSVAAEAAYVAGGYAEYDAPRMLDMAQPCRRVLGAQAIPCIILPTGTITAGGVLTSGTALALTYQRAWVYLPAGAVVGGSAGWYYAVGSSTTVFQVYTAYQATMDKPYIPTTLTAAVGVGGAYTGVTSAVSMGSVVVPANAMGAFGAVEIVALGAWPTNANNKTFAARFGASAVLSTVATTTLGMTVRKKVQNRATNAQVIQAAAETGAAIATSPSLLAIDTTADVVADIQGTMAVATDYLVLESFSVELVPSP
jgi:hypothetical protein